MEYQIQQTEILSPEQKLALIVSELEDMSSYLKKKYSFCNSPELNVLDNQKINITETTTNGF